MKLKGLYRQLTLRSKMFSDKYLGDSQIMLVSFLDEGFTFSSSFFQALSFI